MPKGALMQPESRAALRRIVHQGWTDAIRARHPDGAVYTFWDYTAGCWQRDAGFRIDHLLLSPQAADRLRSEEHTSELQSLMRISYAVFCLKKKTRPVTQRRAATRTAKR